MMRRHTFRLAVAAAASLFLAACQERAPAKPYAESVQAGESPLALQNGDKLLGFYIGCQEHLDQDAWDAVLGDPDASNLWVVPKDTGCQLWLTGFLRNGNEQLSLVLPGDDDTETSILIQPAYQRMQAANVKSSTTGEVSTMVNAMGTGLTFSQSTFGILILTSLPGTLDSVVVPASYLPPP